MKLSIQQIVKDESSQVLFKVRLKTLANKLGFSSFDIEQMQIVASEMLSNQLKYSNKTGMVQLWFNDNSHKVGHHSDVMPITIDIFAMDFGPGISDLGKALQDGFTTSRTMGKGLGSIKRLAHEYDLYTLSGDIGWHGVAVWARFYKSKKEIPKNYQIGYFSKAYHNMPCNGDDIWLNMKNNLVTWLHIDGTGHGKNAENIVRKVRSIKMDLHSQSAQHMLDITCRALNESDGAAGLAFKYNPVSFHGEYSGVGDMRMVLIKENKMSDLTISSGVLGHVTRNYGSHSLSLESGDLLMSASDGIRRNWALNDFPNLWDRHPQLICFFLGDRKGRKSDDQSLIALRKL